MSIATRSVTVQTYETHRSRNYSFCRIHWGNLRVSELPTKWCRQLGNLRVSKLVSTKAYRILHAFTYTAPKPLASMLLASTPTITMALHWHGLLKWIASIRAIFHRQYVLVITEYWMSTWWVLSEWVCEWVMWWVVSDWVRECIWWVLNEWVCEEVNDVSEWMIEWVSEWVCECMYVVSS